MMVYDCRRPTVVFPKTSPFEDVRPRSYFNSQETTMSRSSQIDMFVPANDSADWA